MTSDPSQGLVLYNADVLTLDSQRPRAGLVAVKGNRILSVANSDALGMFRGVSDLRLIDCHGYTLIPGFHDAHCHPFAFFSSLSSVDCSPARVKSIAGIKARIREQAERTPPGNWIRAAGYHEFYLTEKRHPTRRDIDEAAPDHPVKLTQRSGHACVLNSMALRLMGISNETEEPPGGLIDRDLETGEPNGILFGMEKQIGERMPPLDQGELDQAVRIGNQQYLSQGITSLQDATWNDSLKRWHDFQELKQQGKLASRVSMMVGISDLEKFRERGLATGSGDTQLKVGSAKIVLDETRGSLNPPQDELDQQVLQAHQAGFQVALHAVEESTVEAATGALESALRQVPRGNHRHRLEHCSVCPPRLTQRLKALQAVIVTQPPFIYYSGDRYLETVPESQLRWLYPIGSWLKSNVKVAASSDSPVAPSHPMQGIHAAVTRRAESGGVLQPEEGVSTGEALEMYTLSAAYSSFEETIKGSITPGKLADLVLLSGDPLRAPAETIRVIMTIIDGRVVWEGE